MDCSRDMLAYRGGLQYRNFTHAGTGPGRHTQISMCVNVSDTGTAAPEDLIHRADAAMYAAKQNRRHAPDVRAA